jgi:competence protein ComEC
VTDGYRLVAPALTAWAAAAVAPALGATAAVVTGAVVLLTGLAVAAASRHHRLAAGVLLTTVAATAGLLAAGLRAGALESGPLTRLAEQRMPVTLHAVVTGDPRARGDTVLGARRVQGGWLVTARAEVVVVPPGEAVRTRHPVLVIGDGAEWSSLLPGTRVVVRGSLAPPRRSDDGVAALRARGAPVVVAVPPAHHRVAGRVRAGLHDAAGVLPHRERGLLPGLVIGDTSRLDPALREDFRRTGLTHLVAVSGANAGHPL